LDLGFRPALGKEHFWVSTCNYEAVKFIDVYPNWPNGLLILYGPAGCGKTHLANVFAGVSDALDVDSTQLTQLDPVELAHTAPALILEDIDHALAKHPQQPRALFHIFNTMQAAKRAVLMTAQTPPSQWGIRLPDLKSRLALAPCIEISSPDDGLMAWVLQKAFSDRQVPVGQDLIDYLLKRVPPTFADMHHVVAAIDQYAMAKKRQVTLPLLREILPTLGLSPK
jgi:chromosomal replication initiation ATPase DnaA